MDNSNLNKIYRNLESEQGRSDKDKSDKFININKTLGLPNMDLNENDIERPES